MCTTNPTDWSLDEDNKSGTIQTIVAGGDFGKNLQIRVAKFTIKGRMDNKNIIALIESQLPVTIFTVEEFKGFWEVTNCLCNHYDDMRKIWISTLLTFLGSIKVLVRTRTESTKDSANNINRKQSLIGRGWLAALKNQIAPTTQSKATRYFYRSSDFLFSTYFKVESVKWPKNRKLSFKIFLK